MKFAHFLVATEMEWQTIGFKKKKQKDKEEERRISRRKARVDLGVASAFDKRCARRAPVARVTCGRSNGGGRRKRRRERPPELLLSQEGLALLGVLCACERAPRKREEEEKRRVTASLYQPA